MKIVKCPNCGGNVEQTSNKCPYCGVYFEKKSSSNNEVESKTVENETIKTNAIMENAEEEILHFINNTFKRSKKIAIIPIAISIIFFIIFIYIVVSTMQRF